MKKTAFILTLLLGSAHSAFCQYEPPVPMQNTDEKTIKPISCYLGLGTGLFSKYGMIGIAGGIKVNKTTVAELTGGLGGWGYKMGASLTFNVKDKNGWCPSVGFGRSVGTMGIGKEMDVEVNYAGVDKTAKTFIEYGAVNLLFFSFQRQFVGKQGNRFVMEFGYSIPIGILNYGFANGTATIDNAQVSTGLLSFTENQKAKFQLANPSGLMLSLSYHFAFKQRD